MIAKSLHNMSEIKTSCLNFWRLHFWNGRSNNLFVSFILSSVNLVYAAQWKWFIGSVSKVLRSASALKTWDRCKYYTTALQPTQCGKGSLEILLLQKHSSTSCFSSLHLVYFFWFKCNRLSGLLLSWICMIRTLLCLLQRYPAFGNTLHNLWIITGTS